MNSTWKPTVDMVKVKSVYKVWKSQWSSVAHVLFFSVYKYLQYYNKKQLALLQHFTYLYSSKQPEFNMAYNEEICKAIT